MTWRRILYANVVGIPLGYLVGRGIGQRHMRRYFTSRTI